MWSQSIEKPGQSVSRLVRGVGCVAIAFVFGGTAWVIGRSVSVNSDALSQPELVSREPQIKTVTALGRLQPKGDIVRLSAPAASGTSRISQLRISEGDALKAGDIIAVLDSRDRLQAAVQEAKSQINIAQANLAQVMAGSQDGAINAQVAELARIRADVLGDETAQREVVARIEAQFEGDIATQKANLNRLKSSYQNAQLEYQRYQNLHRQGAISDSQRDAKALTYDSTAQQVKEAEAVIQRTTRTAQRQIKEARVRLEKIKASGEQQIAQASATLDRVSEVRPVDVRAAQAEVGRAQAALKQAEVSLEDAYVRSPQNGAVLEIFARPGEVIGNDGIAEIGQIQQMYAIAEIYESDISKVRTGHDASITSPSLPGILTGQVERVDAKVQRQNVINADPTDNIDSRVVEAHIRLDQESSQRVRNFTNLQVKVVIEQ